MRRPHFLFRPRTSQLSPAAGSESVGTDVVVTQRVVLASLGSAVDAIPTVRDIGCVDPPPFLRPPKIKVSSSMYQVCDSFTTQIDSGSPPGSRLLPALDDVFIILAVILVPVGIGFEMLFAFRKALQGVVHSDVVVGEVILESAELDRVDAKARWKAVPEHPSIDVVTSQSVARTEPTAFRTAQWVVIRARYDATLATLLLSRLPPSGNVSRTSSTLIVTRRTRKGVEARSLKQNMGLSARWRSQRSATRSISCLFGLDFGIRGHLDRVGTYVSRVVIRRTRRAGEDEVTTGEEVRERRQDALALALTIHDHVINSRDEKHGIELRLRLRLRSDVRGGK